MKQQSNINNHYAKKSLGQNFIVNKNFLLKLNKSIKINEKELEFSEGFEDLHIKSYKQILKGQGFGLKDNYDTIKTISLIRTSKVSPLISDYHPRLKEI